jgi:ubiquitin C-terminal hydrolase
VDAQKRITLHATPHILSLHLKRFGSLFGSRGAKLNKPIHFPETLDVQPYVSSGTSAATGPSLRYRLYAIIVHAGHTCNSGHYYSYVKSSNGAWYCMDDTEVGCALRES